ncbi:CHAP domain-containing protein [Streptomyces sp. NBC_00841]|uniref:CHAP domain-containing protein n=1 Tax=Streptomyces sp. NBC_00841 TaxID=2975847 RepID=UPI002DDA99D4|nr:CHAP domain-containing protein [Streptomyces sp. NBC_00841]WRZ98061.1 CHAP domain-containing protein [Streptomyces sp. NBC_00841]
MGTNPTKIIAVAKDEVGYHEGRSNGHWNNKTKYAPAVPGLEWADWQAWCATFVSWCALKADVAALYPRTASCAAGVTWFKGKGRFSEYPAVGAQVFFGAGGGTHTGLVYDYDATYIYTVEGNTNNSGSAEGDGVYLKKRVRRDAHVYGYGYPLFTDGIKSADPAYADEAPKPAKPPVTAPAPAPKPSATKPKPVVDLSNILDARKRDMPASTGHTTHKADVIIVERALHAEGLLPAAWVDGSWGTKTQNAYDAFRRKAGYTGDDAKGAPGLASLRKLGAKHGWSVKA